MFKQSLFLASVLFSGLTYAEIADQWQPVAANDTTTYLINPTRIHILDKDKQILELWEKVEANKKTENPRADNPTAATDSPTNTNNVQIRIVEKVTTDREPSNNVIKIGEFVLFKKQISCSDAKMKILKTVNSNHDGKMDKGLLTNKDAEFVAIDPKSADESVAKRACSISFPTP